MRDVRAMKERSGAIAMLAHGVDATGTGYAMALPSQEDQTQIRLGYDSGRRALDPLEK